MHAVSIHDPRIDLHEIVEALGEPVRRYMWLVDRLECSGDELTEKVAEASGRRGHAASAEELAELAKHIVQTVRGEFVAVEPSFEDPRALVERWRAERSGASILIRAVDGHWVVAAGDPALLDALRRRFKDVRDEPAR